MNKFWMSTPGAMETAKKIEKEKVVVRIFSSELHPNPRVVIEANVRYNNPTVSWSSIGLSPEEAKKLRNELTKVLRKLKQKDS